jgi:hypothetical protein
MLLRACFAKLLAGMPAVPVPIDFSVNFTDARGF